ncbi:MAG: NTP transferase domain-containing protein, partial [Longimicrobiales bacterium]
MTDRAVILAAGRGTRMRVPAAAVPMDPAQRVMAERGLKGLIPFHGHPFLAHAVTALADAGIREVCLVVGPGDDAVRATFAAVPATRVRFTFAVQEEPRGSAHALLAAAAFAGEAS